MIYYFPERYIDLWKMLSKTVDLHYSHLYSHNDFLMFAPHIIGKHIDIYRNIHSESKAISYQLEPLASNKHWWSKDLIINQINAFDEIWDYDYQNILILKSHGINAKFRPILPTPSLQIKENYLNPDIDVLFIGAFSEYRMNLLSKFYYMQNTYYNFVVIANVHHPLLDDYVARSKIVLNLHNSEDQKQQEQSRLSYLLTYGKIIMSEKSNINYYGDCINEYDNHDELFYNVFNELENYNFSKHEEIRKKFLSLKYDDYLNRGLEWEQKYELQI